MIYNHHISLIGFGEVGSACAALLNTKLSKVLFNIIDPNPQIEGRILDFAHACAAYGNEVLCNDRELLENADFIVYAAGFSNAKGESRNSVALQNKELVFEIFSDLSLKPTALIIAVTNPVDLIPRWIFDCLNHSNLVIGTGTSLDSFRLNYILSKHENCSIQEVDSLVLGEHGTYMIPIESISSLGGKSINKLYSKEQLYGFYEEMKGAATQIRQTEKATKYGVAACVEKIILAYLGKEEIKMPLSVRLSTFYKSLLSVEESIYMSLPCIIANQDIYIQELEHLTENERRILSQAALHLQNEFKSI